MTQLTINIEDQSILPHLKKILLAIRGISIAPEPTKQSTGWEEAMDDIKEGRIYDAASVRDMYRQILD